MDSFDYIIVGAGSAGCVLANRLSADPASSVLLLEAGGEDSSYFIGLPKGFAKLLNDPKHIWSYKVDQPRGNGANTNETWTYGRGLGGSSSVNGMAYVRGQPEDYEEWARLAGPNWGWAEMKRAFRSIENHELGDDGLRGSEGALSISTGYFRYPLADRLIAAGEQMGLLRKDDLNAEEQEGVGYLSHNIKRGKRHSASAAFLKPARHRPNLKIVTDALVDRVLFEDGRATAVDCRVGGRRTRFLSSGEIIVSAGSIQSPKLLQLSGIGPGDLLRSHGVEVVHDCPDVGNRMLDHLTLAVVSRLKGGERGLNHRFRGLGLARSLAQYLLFRTGPLAGGPLEVGVFARVGSDATRPDVELMIGGTSMAAPDENDASIGADPLPGMTVFASMIRLTSEGTIRISSADPDAALDIAPNWLSTEHDRTMVVATLRYVRRFLAQPAIASVLGAELAPGPGTESEQDIIDWGYRTAFCGLHAVGTCRMGCDEASVVDERLRVRGVDGLRVVDCSAMPGRISGNTNGPAMAFAWRASDLILEDAQSDRA